MTAKTLLLFFITTSIIYASENQNQKRKLNNNSTLTFLETPKEVDKLSEFLSKGEFYGRFRLNSFSFDWDDEVEGKTGDHQTIGVGGSAFTTKVLTLMG